MHDNTQMTAIEQLLAQPESKTLEFKRNLSSPKPLLKTLVAFANTAGGRLIIGMGDARLCKPDCRQHRVTARVG